MFNRLKAQASATFRVKKDSDDSQQPPVEISTATISRTLKKILMKLYSVERIEDAGGPQKLYEELCDEPERLKEFVQKCWEVSDSKDPMPLWTSADVDVNDLADGRSPRSDEID